MQLDYTKIVDVLRVGEDNASILEELSNNIVNTYCESLNALMLNIKNDIGDRDDISTVTLERYLFLLADEIFWATDKLESAEIRASIHKSIATEAYNKSYINASTVTDGKKPTVNELTAIATQDSLTEQMTSNLQNSVRDRIKGRIDGAQCMHRTLTRMLARRQEEQNII